MKADRHEVKTIERRTTCPIKKVYDTDFVGHSKGEFCLGEISTKFFGRPNFAK